MKNLMGYHVQGRKNGEGFAPSPASDVLIHAPSYPGPVSVPGLALSYENFMNGKRCFVGYNYDGETFDLNGRINCYAGPYWFGFGLVEVPPVEGFREKVGGYVDISGNIVEGAPENGFSFAHCYLCYCIVGDIDDSGDLVENLPADAFCPNINQGYAWPNMFSMKDYVAAAILAPGSLKFSQGRVQYKFNGRFVGAGGKGEAVQNVNSSLKTYDGFSSWASGWLYPDNSVYGYIRRISEYTLPSTNKTPFTTYSHSGFTVTPNFIMYPEYVTAAPSISTYTYIGGNTATASTVDYTSNILTSQAIVNACAAPSVGAVDNNPLQLQGLFDGFVYPSSGRTGTWLPSWAAGYIFTSEGVSL